EWAARGMPIRLDIMTAPPVLTVRRVVTTRAGGFSAPPYDSFNLGDHVGDDPEAVRRNRARLAASLDLPADHLIWMDQIHGRTMATFDGIRTEAVSGITALFSARPGLALVVMTADCVSILLSYDEVGVIAAVNAGRVGARFGIVPRVQVAMVAAGVR